MPSLPRIECPKCERNVAVTVTGLLYRHDPKGGRTPDLKSCPGSLKPVLAPRGQPVLFVSPEDVTMPEPAGLF